MGHHHIIERHKIILATVARYAHGASIIAGSAKLATPVDRSSYLARAISASYSAPKLHPVTDRTRNVRTTPSTWDYETRILSMRLAI
jgi:hypothetical protein